MTNKFMGKQGLNEHSAIIEEYKDHLKAIWKGSKPLAKLFKTDSCFYLYDTGTNKIVKCLEPVYHLLEKLLAFDIDTAIREYLEIHDFDQLAFSAETIKKAIKTEKILQTMKAEEFGVADEFCNYSEMIASSLEVLFLEITESCSLRCKYCVYAAHVTNRRNHGEHAMTPEIAYKAIDYLKQHSSNSKNVSLSFYGGEPLLEFELIKSCVEYARSIFMGKTPDFSITTNGTLLRPDIAEFLHKNDFRVQLSLDGPMEIHDSYRVDIKGKGSFDSTIRGLKYLLDVYGDSSSRKIFFNMVYTPPFSEKRLNRIAQLWEELSWLPKDLNLNISYPSPGSIPTELCTDKPIAEDKNLQQWCFEKFREGYVGEGNSHPIANSIIERGIALLLQRPVYDDSINRFSLNGCCVPGVRRLFVDTFGKFRVCERIGNDAPLIGNVQSGIDLKLIEKVFIDGYKEVIVPYCSVCWAIGLCSACYTNIFKEGKMDFAQRENDCYILKKSQERFLNFYCSLMELDPKGIEYLYKYELQ